MSARDEVLARIRSALDQSSADAGTDVPREYRAEGEHSPGSPALVDLLTERLVDYRATVHHCAPEGVAATVTEALRAGSIRRLVTPVGLPAAWLSAESGLDLVPDAGSGLTIEELDGMDGVVTGCAVAVAETGTIILDAGADQGRRIVTLVPDYHLIVVRNEQVVQTVPEALRRLDPRQPITMVSGPSATSDIELNRVEGVHGPRTLVVVLVS